MSSFDYMSRRWLRLRAAVMRDVIRRDGAPICQWSKRFGRRVEATQVHHIWPAEDFPQYAWERWNLIALSPEAHNAMHDRRTGKLSAVGEQLRRRTIPPSSPLADRAAVLPQPVQLSTREKNSGAGIFAAGASDEEDMKN